jgi:hypothetical protein
MPDQIDEFLTTVGIEGTQHRADARRLLQAMLDAARLAGCIEGHDLARAMVMRVLHERQGAA